MAYLSRRPQGSVQTIAPTSIGPTSSSYLNTTDLNEYVDYLPDNYSYGKPSQGGTLVTNPLYDYGAFRNEVGLDESFGQYTYGGQLVRGQAQIWDKTLPNGQQPETISNYGEINGVGVGINVSVDWQLAAKQAYFGSPEWARKVLADRAPPANDMDYAYQAAYPSVQSKLNYMTGGNDYSSSGRTTDALGNSFTSQVKTVDYVLEDATYDNDGNMLTDDTWWATDRENVTAYGIPAYRSGERIAPLESSLSQQGTFFSPTYDVTSSPVRTSVNLGGTRVSDKSLIKDLYSIAVNDKYDMGWSTSASKGLAQDYNNTVKYWGASAGTSLIQKAYGGGSNNYTSPTWKW